MQQELGSSWDGQPLGHNRHWWKRGGCCARFGRGGSWVPI